jgi:hypothetical protein
VNIYIVKNVLKNGLRKAIIVPYVNFDLMSQFGDAEYEEEEEDS